MGEAQPICDRCHCALTIKHILTECPYFSAERLRHFNQSSFNLTALIGKDFNSSGLFAFLSEIFVLHHI